MTIDNMGASPDGDRAVVNGAGQAVSALRASVPSAVLGVLARRASGGNVRNIYDTLHGAYSMDRIRGELRRLRAVGLVEVMPTAYRRIFRWRVTPAGFEEALGIPYPAQVIEARSGETRQGLDPKGESAVAKPCAHD